MKWPTVLRNTASGSPTESRFRSRLPVHLLRFTVLVVGLLVVGELFIGLGTCLDVKYGNPLEGAARMLERGVRRDVRVVRPVPVADDRDRRHRGIMPAAPAAGSLLPSEGTGAAWRR